MKIVLTLQILHSALEFPRIFVALFKRDPHEKKKKEMTANEKTSDKSGFYMNISKATF